MRTVTTLPRNRPLTRRDLETMPDDGHRYELVDGTLVVTPAPSRRHQLVDSRLTELLTRGCPSGLLVVGAPLDVELGEDTVVQPDLIVVRRAAYDDESRPLQPLLAVEILSPSTRRFDLTLKRDRYQAAGIPAYWVVDPDRPALLALRLEAGRYVEDAHVAGEDAYRTDVPFEVTVVPAHLVA